MIQLVTVEEKILSHIAEVETQKTWEARILSSQ